MMNVEAKSFLLNDIDSFVIAIHRLLCSYLGRLNEFYSDFLWIVDKYGLSHSYRGNTVPEDLKKAFPKTYFAKFNKEAYANLKKDFNAEGKKDIMKLYVLLIYGFNRMLRFNSKGDFNLPVGDVDFNKNTYEALNDYFTLLLNKDVKWYNQDFREFITGIEFQQDDLVYLDPPYLITFSEYNKLWDENTETALLQLLDELNSQRVKFAISNVTHYKGKINDIFLDWSNNYNCFSIKSNYISFNDNSIKEFKEVLVTNF